MTGMAKESLKSDKRKLLGSIKNIEESLSLLKNKESGYADEHRVLINTYTEMINCIDKALGWL